MRKVIPSCGDLASILNYNPDDGEFTYKVARGNRAKGDTAGSLSNGYVMIKFNGRKFGAHQLAVYLMTGRWPDTDVDHINMVKDDNRWCNLRVVPRCINSLNNAATNIRKLRDTGKWHFTGVLIMDGNKRRFQRRASDVAPEHYRLGCCENYSEKPSFHCNHDHCEGSVKVCTQCELPNGLHKMDCSYGW